MIASIDKVRLSSSRSKTEGGSIRLIGCQERNLKNIDVDFQIGKLNEVSGRSGTGKASLVKDTLLKVVQQHLGVKINGAVKLANHENIDAFNKLIFIDHSPKFTLPIGLTAKMDADKFSITLTERAVS